MEKTSLLGTKCILHFFSRFLEIPGNVFLVAAFRLNLAHVATSQESFFFRLCKWEITIIYYFSNVCYYIAQDNKLWLRSEIFLFLAQINEV